MIRKDGKVVSNCNGIPIGSIQDGILFKRVIASKHMLQRPRGWAWDWAVIEEAKRAGITQTLIKDTENEIDYMATLEAFEKYGVRIDRGFCPQVVLPLDKFNATPWMESQPKLF